MENPAQKGRYAAALMAATGVVFFSAKAIFVKLAYSYDVDSVSFLLIRMVIALPFYLVVGVVVSLKSKESPLTRNDIVSLILLGVTGYYLASYLDFRGLNFVTASMERLILFVYPTLVLLISALVLKKTVTVHQKLAVAITYVGVLMAFYKYGESAGVNSNILLGSILIFGSAFTYASYLVGSGKLIPKIGSVRFTSYAMVVSCIAVIIHFVLRGNVNVFEYQPEVYKLGLGVAVISTIIPSFLLAAAIKRIGAPNVAIIGSIGPVSTIILASVFLGERITVFQFAGTLVVISGIMLLGLQGRKNKEVTA